MPKKPRSEALDWPPYGPVNTDFAYDIATKRVPVGFRIGGRAASEADYIGWLDRLVDELADFLWPRYVPGKAQPWQGNAVAQARDLTLADFALMKELRLQLEAAPVGRDPDLALSHKALLIAEDLGKPWPTYAHYETALAADVMSKVQESMHKPVFAFGPAPLRIKELLQRPRPYQMALILGIKGFEYEWAKSAVTPSIISGHSLQGVMAGAGAFVAHLLDLQKVAGAARHLEQYAVDVGDRRVFAGVHFPSDNIGSWFVALKLCDNYVFGELGAQARSFLWRAISQRSIVFAAMTKVGGPYAKPLERLAKLAAAA